MVGVIGNQRLENTGFRSSSCAATINKVLGDFSDFSNMKMRGNLRTKNAELIEKVKTSYEIQNEQK